MNKSKLLSREKIEAAFKAFDADGSGEITADEIKQFLGKSNNYNEEVWNELIREVDQNGDGVIDLDEFIYMMERFADPNLGNFDNFRR